MSGEGTDPVEGFRGQLQQLFLRARRPTYRALEAHASQEGRTLRASTIGNLLNGPPVPRWDTVETFVRACARYARAREVPLPEQLVDVDRWHAAYQRMENALADQAAQREQIAGRPVPTRRRRLAVPAQLPPDAAAFTGRVEHLDDLDRLLAAREHPRGPGNRAAAVVISAIAGTAGVGKTALAVHWSHRIRDRFPDGQLYVNLRGFDPSGEGVGPATAVRGFLDALEVPPQRIPADPDAQVALYRSLLFDKRMLIVLDNARDSAQVRPLLPGTSDCLVLVTSRNQLTTLVAETGARALTLDVLTVEEARDLLAHRLGAERTAAEPDAVEEIVTQCARLPLALTLVAAHATLRPHTALRDLAEELRDTRQRWHTLAGDDPDTDIQAVFSWSYHTLTPQAARLFRLLGLHHGPDVGTVAGASLAGVPVEQVRPLLAKLVQANLVVEPTSGRYTMHDLLRAYATHLTHAEDADDERDAATRRLLDHYLHTAHPAALLLNPTRDAIGLDEPQHGTVREDIADLEQALAWFTLEHRVLLAAVERADSTGYETHAWRLAWTLDDFLDRRGHWYDRVVTGRVAVAAAAWLSDAAAEARAHRNLANAYTQLGRVDDAHVHLRQALHLYHQIGDSAAQSHTQRGLAHLYGRQGRHTLALDHARQALDLSRDAGHQAAQARSLNSVGWYHTLLGDHEQALAYCEQALALHQQLGDRYGLANTRDSIGYAHHHLARYADAVTCYQHAIDLFHDLGERYGEAATRVHLGDTHHATGNLAAAREAWQQALVSLDELDHPDADAVRAKLAELDTPPRAEPSTVRTKSCPVVL